MPGTPRRWMLLFSAAVVACIFAAAALSASGRYEAFVLYAAFDPFCHQQVERSWSVLSQPLPVCVRCLGLYLGAFAAAAAGARFSKRWFLAASGILIATAAGEIAGLAAFPSGLRCATGFLFGFTLASALTGRARNHLVPHRAGAPGGFSPRDGRSA